MGSSTSTYASSPDNFQEVYRPEGGLSTESVELLNGLNCHSNIYALLDPNSSRILFVSSSFEHLTGYSFQQIESKYPQDLLKEAVKIDPKQVDRLIEALENRLRWHLSLLTTDLRNDTDLNIEPLSNENGEISCTLCSIELLTDEKLCKEDVTASLLYRIKKANECMQSSVSTFTRFVPYVKLRNQDQMLIDVLQEREEMFCITDPNMFDNPIVFASDEFIRTIGYNRFEINGINCRFLQGYDTLPEDVDVIRDALRDKKHARVCLLNYRKDGTRFINQFNLSPLWDSNGNLAFFIGVQIQVDDVEILPFPNSRQTLAEMLLDYDL